MKKLVLVILSLCFYSVSFAQTPEFTLTAPSFDQNKVISLSSAEYQNVIVDTWKTDWSVSDYQEVFVGSKKIHKYSNLDFVGIETINHQLDLSGMTHFHVDMWTPNAFLFAVKLVDFGADGAYGGGDDTEHQIEFPNPIPNQWNSFDNPLDHFTGMTSRNHFSQLIFVGQPTAQSTIFVDNVLFYDERMPEPLDVTGFKSPSLSAMSGEIIKVPITLVAKEEDMVTSVEFVLDKTLIGATMILDNFMMPTDWLIEVNEIGDQIAYAAAGANPFVGEMDILELELTVNTDVSLKTRFSVSNVFINEEDMIPVQMGELSFEPFMMDKAMVWPGDTNNDGVVSEIDVLPLGMFYELTGPKRSNVTIDWQGFEVDYWEIPDATYADAFGDGAVTLNDIAGVTNNFGLEVPVLKRSKNKSDKLTSFEIPLPPVNKGDLVRISFSLGDAVNPIQGLMGAAMRIVVPVEFLEYSDFIPVDLLSTENLIPFMHYDEETFQLSMAATRTRLEGGIDGFGNFAELEFIALETVPISLNIPLLSVVTSTTEGINYTPTVGVSVAIETAFEHEVNALPTEFTLYQNYPNPFNPSTQIRFDIPQNGKVTLDVFNMLGQKVATLVNKDLSTGTHSVNFDATNLSSGMYLYKLTSGNSTITQKMMLIK